MQAFRQFVRRLVSISEARLDAESRMLRLKWNNGTDVKSTPISTSLTNKRNDHIFPFVWLRDNCQCDQCFHHASTNRRSVLQNLDCNASPNEVKIAPEEDKVTLTWTDGHISVFEADWLFNRDFDDAAQGIKSGSSGLPQRLWGSELQGNIPTMSYAKLLSDDMVLYDWLKAMEEYGLVVLEGAPKEPKQLHVIANRICFLRPSIFGETFRVRTKTDGSSVAYTALPLGLHTDLPGQSRPPGIQLLHCITQADDVDGGENVFVDGFNAAYDMKNAYPEEYQTLTTVPINYFNVGEDYYTFRTHGHHCVIELSASGEVQQINYSDLTRDSRLGISVERVQEFYNALKVFSNTMYHERNALYTKLKEGDVVAFDNLRVLHGRRGYKVKDKDIRHLEGGYLEWDDMRSRRRVLQKAQGIII